ncbi:MAG: bifunctional ornithine acetyltransferase/N-acetylglutamate synthase [Oscillospiraceae bacterium]
MALIVSESPCAAAAVYTQNKVKGAPIAVTKEHLADGRAQAVIVNSGNANTCNADGVQKARMMCGLASRLTGIAESDVIVASTGVIGEPLPIEPILAAGDALLAGLSESGGDAAAEAIMTTDTFSKQAAVAFSLNGKTCRIGGMAKGSGMIHPNMATMLGFLTTDARISPALLQKALQAAVDTSFNAVDDRHAAANGASGEDTQFARARLVCTDLAKQLADGEGASSCWSAVCRARICRRLGPWPRA